MIDITDRIRSTVAESNLKNGAALVFVPHTTAAVTINENADPDVQRDMVMEINKIVPRDDGYRHAEGNSAAHIKSTLVGASEWLMVENCRPVLGTWQGIYFCEFDGPRSRRLHIKVLPA
jgi:secondary thiamine-phosphate synthase enzyme